MHAPFRIAMIPLCCWLGSTIIARTEQTTGKEIAITKFHKEGKMETTNQTNQVAESAIPRVERPKLHAAEKLSYSTVRVLCKNPNGISYGTGFFYDIPHPTNPNFHIPIIVSNRHVVKDVQNTTFTMTLAATNGLPSADQYTINMDNGAYPWIGHPDPTVDLSFLLIAPALIHMQQEGKSPFYYAMDSSLIPDDSQLKAVTQTDEVIMIGYPGALWDNVNNQPIFRKGTLATNPGKDFCGRHEFLIDMPVFCGSSGSPVLLFSDGLYFDREKGQGKLGGRLVLLGINYATIESTVSGKVVPVPVPTVVEDGEGTNTVGNSNMNSVPRKERLVR